MIFGTVDLIITGIVVVSVIFAFYRGLLRELLGITGLKSIFSPKSTLNLHFRGLFSKIPAHFAQGFYKFDEDFN